MNRLTITLGLLGLVAVLAACSSTSAAPTASQVGSPTGETVTMTASDLAFGQAELTVPAETAFDLVFDNQDSAPHNVAIYTDSTASTKVSVGEIFTGPAQKTQSVPALAAGTYFFRCDVHPDMNGSLIAE